MMWMSLAVSFGILLALMCVGDLRKTFPHNFILLGIFTLFESLLLGVFSAHMDTKSVVMAIGITAVVCVSLTIFAFQTKIDFTVYTGAAFVGLMILILMGFVMMFVKAPIAHIVYGGFGAILFSFFLLIDTQMIVGGTRQVTISPEEYILAVITLYMDIIQLFLYILQILNASK